MFFGCEVPMTSIAANGTTPMMIYIPNAPKNTKNPGTDQMSTITDSVDHGRLVALQDNAIRHATRPSDTNWKNCMACALFERSRQRAGLERSAGCQTCFNEYCWIAPGQNTDAPVTPARHKRLRRRSLPVDVPDVVSWPSIVRL